MAWTRFGQERLATGSHLARAQGEAGGGVPIDDAAVPHLCGAARAQPAGAGDLGRAGALPVAVPLPAVGGAAPPMSDWDEVGQMHHHFCCDFSQVFAQACTNDCQNVFADQFLDYHGRCKLSCLATADHQPPKAFVGSDHGRPGQSGSHVWCACRTRASTRRSGQSLSWRM